MIKNFIVDDIGAVVEAMKGAVFTEEFTDEFVGKEIPFYRYGHRVEIAALLDQQNRGTITQKVQKYPLIALRLDTEETISAGIIHFNLNIAIVECTEKNYDASQRYENVYKPVLYPLYERFMEALKQSGLFFWENMSQYPPHTKVDRLYYGTLGSEGNQKRVFQDPLDAIEILNLKINQTLKNC
jgi:hypothetical protein